LYFKVDSSATVFTFALSNVMVLLSFRYLLNSNSFRDC